MTDQTRRKHDHARAVASETKLLSVLAEIWQRCQQELRAGTATPATKWIQQQAGKAIETARKG